jgi:hypothetical protein
MRKNANVIPSTRRVQPIMLLKELVVLAGGVNSPTSLDPVYYLENYELFSRTKVQWS